MPESTVLSCDIAVVGAGISGMISAVRSAQGGRRVIVFEKTTDERYVCNSRLTAGIWHCCQMDVLSDPGGLEAKILEVTGGAARPDLARAVATDAVRAIRYMQSLGIRFIKGPMAYQTFMLSPPTITPQGRQWEGRGGDVMLRTFETELNKLGGRILRGHRAVQLVQHDKRITGFTGDLATGGSFTVDAKAVIIADGGFQANPELTRGPVTTDPSRVLQRNAATGMGDGMRMAQQAGAALTDLRGFYGHVQSCDALRTDKLWPYSWLDFLLAAGMIVGRDGRRFTDEGQGGVAVANVMAQRTDPLDATVIIDERIWQERGTFNILPPNPRLLQNGGTVYKADTLEALACQAGVDSAGLSAQVEEYNHAVKVDSLAGLQPARTTIKFEAFPVERAPFYGIPAVAGITYTMGGISIDADARVLTPDGSTLPGLYAVGCATGGLEGGEKKGYVGGLVKSSVTGLRAAEAILADAA
jgi:fumarate reductase flavoprotein subunit